MFLVFFVGQCCLALEVKKNKKLTDLQVVATILVWLDTSPWSTFCQYQKVIITLKAQCWTWEMQHEPLKGMEGICLENLEKYQANRQSIFQTTLLKKTLGISELYFFATVFSSEELVSKNLRNFCVSGG